MVRMAATSSATGGGVDVTAAIRAFCAQQREWLELELQSEQEQQGSTTPSSSSHAKGGNNNNNNELTTQVLSNLQVAEVSVGLYGRTVVRFELNPTSSNAAAAAAAAASPVASSSLLLPAHRFTTGDEVEIRSKSHGKSASASASRSSNPGGVISQVTDASISVALSSNKNDSQKKQRKDKNDKKNDKNDKDNDDDDNDDDMLGIPPPFSLIPKSSAQVHKKMIIALDQLEKQGMDHPVAGRVVRALFDPNQSSSTVQHSRTSKQSSSLSSSSQLDASQLEAISFCLADDRPISLIHGPPGTGKTTTVVSLIQQAVLEFQFKVLVVAPSNVAVDNVLARLVAPPPPPPAATAATTGGTNSKQPPSHRMRAIRLGHPARLQASILPYSLEALVQAADGTEIVSDVRKELQSYLKVLSNPGSRGNDKRVAYQEVKALRKEIRTREEKVVSELLKSAQVVLATCVGADNRLLRHQAFDLVVIDEAAQALEAACWIPVLKAKRVVLAGDHCQLPPTIKSNLPRVQEGLGQTMFERLMDLYGDHGTGSSGSSNPASRKGPGRVSRMLKVQYRMHESIANWASQALYGGELQTHASVKSRTLAQLTGKSAKVIGAHGEAEDYDDEFDSVAETALLLVDTAGCSMFESVNPAGSRFNEGEAQLVAKHVRTLLSLGVRQDQIAIITPYNGQVELLRSTLLPDSPKLEIRSVDGFQGGERDAVILSLVRSSDRGGMDGIGFLRDERRLNVAVTRAKRHCCVICDSETVSQSSFIKNLIDWIEDHGETRSALEFLPDSDNSQMDSDILQAEIELERLMQDTSKSTPQNEIKMVPSRTTAQKNGNQKEDPKQKALLEKIIKFVETGKAGESMPLNTELSKFDRKAVHELAEKLGIFHQSDGVEGVDRRITLAIPTGSLLGPVESSPPEAANGVNLDPRDETTIQDEPSATATSFSALQLDDDDDSEEPGGDSDGEDRADDKTEPAVQPALNSVLGDLAKERARREKMKQREGLLQPPAASKKSKNKNKKKGQKLGGSQKAVEASPKVDSSLDDMAFLDAQIDQVQNSHGRKVEGKGGYRTVINGILITPVVAQEKNKNIKASSALQAKLKEAQGDRKIKKKPK